MNQGCNLLLNGARRSKHFSREHRSGTLFLMKRGLKRFLLLAVGLAAVGFAGREAWLYFRPRVIRVWVVSDYAFRQRPKWQAVLESRFQAINRLYIGTGVEWRVVSTDHMDPVSGIAAMDVRRLELERLVDSPADVVVSVTGQGAGDRIASVNPFSHAAVVVDFPLQSEEQNTLNLAHEMARLFGSPVEAAGSDTLMALPPQRPEFSPRTVKLIHRLRNYDFARGIDALTGRWADRALDALADAYEKPSPDPRARAELTLALALENEKRAAEATPHVREAVKDDPQNIDARQALVHILVDDLHEDAAMKEIREAVRLFPNDAGLHATLGVMLAQRVETEDAIGELRKAETLDPKNATYPITLGTLLVQQAGKMDEGMAEFHKSEQIDPRQNAARVWLARMADLRTQATADLEADRRKAREAPQDAEAQFRVGVDQARLGDHEGARVALGRAVELNPRYGQALSDLAAMDYYCKDYQAALRHVRAARVAGMEPPAALVSALDRKLKAAGGSGLSEPAPPGISK